VGSSGGSGRGLIGSAPTRGAVLVGFAVCTLLAARVWLVLTASHQFDAIDNEFS
jgi:hypothetical protein